LVYLREKLRSLFGPGNLKIYWKDEDGDDVLIETDEELMIALQEMAGPVYKLDVVIQEVNVNNISTNTNANVNANEGLKEEHLGVTCDSCEGPVIGFRYKCVKCPDYDLCGTCEAKGHHPGHNMMRIATPETVWPRHFFNRLNKMHERASKMREASTEEAPEEKRPRRGGPRHCGRGRGWAREAFGPLVMGHLDQLSAALDPFGVDVDFHIDPPGGCEVKKAKEAQEAPEAKEAKEVKEVNEGHIAAHNAAHNAALNEAKEAKEAEVTKELKRVEEAMETLEVKETKNVQEEEKANNDNSGLMVPEDMDMEAMTMEQVTPTNEAPPTREATPPLKETQDHEDWTVLDKSPSPEPSVTGAPEPSLTGAEALYPKLEQEDKKDMELPPKVQVALQAMENMGFNNQGGWLSTLLVKYDGDIGKVLDLLNPAKPIRA
jgi:sequestosome 1